MCIPLSFADFVAVLISLRILHFTTGFLISIRNKWQSSFYKTAHLHNPMLQLCWSDSFC
jgi:hypothetical protein